MICAELFALSLTINLTLIMYVATRKTVYALLRYMDNRRQRPGREPFYMDKKKLKEHEQKKTMATLLLDERNMRISRITAKGLTNIVLALIVFTLGMRVLLSGQVFPRDPLFHFGQLTRDALQMLLSFSLFNIGIDLAEWDWNKCGNKRLELLIQQTISALVLIVILYTKECPILVLIGCVMTLDTVLSELRTMLRQRAAHLVSRCYCLVLHLHLASVFLLKNAVPNALLGLAAYRSRHQFFQLSNMSIVLFFFAVCFFFVFNIWHMKASAQAFQREQRKMREARTQRREQVIMSSKDAAGSQQVNNAYVTSASLQGVCNNAINVAKTDNKIHPATTHDDVTCNMSDAELSATNSLQAEKRQMIRVAKVAINDSEKIETDDESATDTYIYFDGLSFLDQVPEAALKTPTDASADERVHWDGIGKSF